MLRSQSFTRLPKESIAQKSKNLCSNIIVITGKNKKEEEVKPVFAF